MGLPRLKFWREWGAASPFWPGDDAAVQLFGLGEIDAAVLGLAPELVSELEAAAIWHDGALNWDYPPHPGPWRREECERFNGASRKLFERCAENLSGRFEIRYTHRDEKEDPDLDVYLASPTSFKRTA